MHEARLAILPLCCAAALAQGTPEVEPNDTAATATPLALGAQADGVIGAPGDWDFWRVTLPPNSDLRCWVNPGIGAALADSDLALIAADGTTELAFNDDSQSPQSWLSVLVAGNLPGGTYYLRVRSSQAADPNGTGTYTLDVVRAARGTYVVTGGNGPGVPIAVAETAESNDPRQPGGQATPSFDRSVNRGNIAVGTGGTAYDDPGADYDFYAIHVTRPGLLELETLPVAAYPAMRDTVLFLADDALGMIAVDDDSGFGRFSRLSRYVFPDTYYAVVKGTDAGNYVLDVRLTAMVAPGSASATVRSGGCGPTLGLRQTTVGPVVRTELPVLGSSYYLDGANMPPFAFLFRVIGVDPLSPPYDLGPIGAPGCLLEVDPLDQSPASADAAGTYHWLLPAVPLKTSLIGLTVEQQLAVVDPISNPLGMTVSNRVSSVFGVCH